MGDVTPKYHTIAGYLNGLRLTTHTGNGPWALHRHDFWEIVVTHEQCALAFNGTRLTLEPYTAFIFRPEIDTHECFSGLHANLKLDDTFFKSICDGLQKGLYDKLMSGELENRITMDATAGEDFFRFYNNYYTIIGLDPAGQESILLASTLDILKRFMLVNLSANGQFKGPKWLVSLVSKLNSPENFSRSISDITSECDLSYMQISRVFGKYMGTSMNEYFLRAKYAYACRLLAETDIPIKNITAEIGYTSTAHFAYTFRQRFHITPLDYRRQSRDIYVEDKKCSPPPPPAAK